MAPLDWIIVLLYFAVAAGIQLTEYPGGTEAKRVNVFLTFQDEEQDPEARFIRLEAVRAPLPEGHPGAGHQGWLFADEIAVH